MSIMNTKADALIKSVSAAELVLMLIFPEYSLVKMPNLILLNKTLEDGTKEQVIINNDNFEQFKSILQEMFCLSFAKSGYKPANKKAAQLAKKFQKRKKILNKHSQQESNQINILYRYISILAIGNHHTIPQLMEYTVYQLFNEFQRFQKKYSYDTWFSAKMAGAEGLQDVDNWLSDEDAQSSSQKKPRTNRIEF